MRIVSREVLFIRQNRCPVCPDKVQRGASLGFASGEPLNVAFYDDLGEVNG